MNGKEMIEIFNNRGMNASAHEFMSLFIEEENQETPVVGCLLILVATEILFNSNDADELEKEVIAQAEAVGEFAGMIYNPNAFLTEDDEDFDGEDEGLSHVAFGDLWNALEKTATLFKIQGYGV